MSKFTLIIGVDAAHLHQFMYSYPTWIKHKKELRDCPTVIIYDRTEINPRDSRLKELSKINSNIKYFKWKPPQDLYKTQKAKMFAALLSAPRWCVDTPWYLQIDTDSYAYNTDEWYKEEWFDEEYKFISNPWGYTKPANAIEIMDNWADNIDYFKNYKRLNYPYKEGSPKIRHKRIASWVIFCNTDWCKKVVDLVGKDTYIQLPVPSQDTFLCFCADRSKEKYRRFSFKRYGWSNTSNTKRLIKNVNLVK